MRIESEPALILHARAYRETSLLLECITRDYGRVGLVARGVRRERSRIPRGLLQPLQPLLLGWSGNGELATLTAAEAADGPITLVGERLYSAIYLNELVLRLCVRADPHPDLFASYVECLRRLERAEPEAWTLRRFERDLLAGLGYALVLDRETDTGEPLQPDADYHYVADSGPVRGNGPARERSIQGAALLALARDEMPQPRHSGQLRRLMRMLIRHHLGGADLNAWTMAPPRAPAGKGDAPPA